MEAGAATQPGCIIGIYGVSPRPWLWSTLCVLFLSRALGFLHYVCVIPFQVAAIIILLLRYIAAITLYITMVPLYLHENA